MSNLRCTWCASHGKYVCILVQRTPEFNRADDKKMRISWQFDRYLWIAVVPKDFHPMEWLKFFLEPVSVCVMKLVEDIFLASVVLHWLE